MELEHVGELIKEERLRRGLSQRDLAERSDGLAQDTISGIERGEHTPRPSTLRKLAKGLGMEVGELLPKRKTPLAKRLTEFEKRAKRVAGEDAMQYAAAKLVRDMEEAILEADRDGAPDDEIEDLTMRSFEITRGIMDARKYQIRTLEEEMQQMDAYKRRFARRLSGEDQDRNAG